MAKPVVVIGAGLAGISAALHLEKSNREVILLESSDRAGGRVATDRIDGYLCDRGFQLINAKYPALQELDVIQLFAIQLQGPSEFENKTDLLKLVRQHGKQQSKHSDFLL